MRKRNIGYILLGLAGIFFLIPIICDFMSPIFYDKFGKPMPIRTIYSTCFISSIVLACAGMIVLYNS